MSKRSRCCPSIQGFDWAECVLGKQELVVRKRNQELHLEKVLVVHHDVHRTCNGASAEDIKHVREVVADFCGMWMLVHKGLNHIALGIVHIQVLDRTQTRDAKVWDLWRQAQHHSVAGRV